MYDRWKIGLYDYDVILSCDKIPSYDEIFTWIESNTIGFWYNGEYGGLYYNQTTGNVAFHFSDLSDAIKFKLIWG